MKGKYRQFSSVKPRRSPREVMAAFLSDCLQPSGRIEINQPRQAATFARAIEEGLITERGELTDKGRNFNKG